MILAAMTVALAMCGFLCACGDDSNTEETVEITTPSEENDATTTEKDTSGKDAPKGKNKSDTSAKADDQDDSQYETIYKECNAAMTEAADKYVDELEKKSGEVTKSKLYDETQDRIEKLKEIYDDSKQKMIDAMLASTEDDVKEYNKYFKKMTEKYTEYSRELTSVYTDNF